jgi:spoIIIJ-associated protein
MNPQAIEIVQKFFAGLLGLLGEDGQVEITAQKSEIYVNLVGPFRFIPTDEEFRAALERVVYLHLKARLPQVVPVVVDQGGRVAAHRQELVARARTFARLAVEERRPITLEPMPPADRRIIHLALADFPGVRTRSMGREKRRVVIEPTS